MKGSWHWYLKTVPACQVRFSISDGSWWTREAFSPRRCARVKQELLFLSFFSEESSVQHSFLGGECLSVVDLEEIVGVKMLERSKVLIWVWKSPLLAWLDYIPEWIVMEFGLRKKTSKQLHYLARYSKQKLGRIDKWATKKKTSYFPLHWLVNRDPYNGLL